MCLGVPGKVINIDNDRAIVNVGEIQVKTSIQLIPEVKEGDFVILHAGFAIQILDETSAVETLELLERISL